MTVLKTAIANYPHTKGLKDGTVSVPGVQFGGLSGCWSSVTRCPPWPGW